MTSSLFQAVARTAYHKGHGTQNDFVLLSDDDGTLELDSRTVALLADRRTGLGGDGVIRVVRSAVSGIDGAAEQAADGAEWFMDYYNHDGSVSEMCGNGVRVFAHTLYTTGRIPADAPEVKVGTRDGIKTVRRVPNPISAGDPGPGISTETSGEASRFAAANGSEDAWYMIDMGRWALDPNSIVIVDTDGIDVPRPGLKVSTGNPHTVVALAASAELDGARLRDQPVLDPVPEDGSNIEYIVMEPTRADLAQGEGALKMRVFERGVGETRSCGTGACAAAIAAHHWAGVDSPLNWRVDIPGGQVRIGITPDPDGTTGTVTLAGPAVLVAAGTLD